MLQRPNANRFPAPQARGFTLLEMLVVLLIVSLTSAIVFPQLTTMAASFEFASQRDTLEQDLNGLSYRAFRDNSDMVLVGTYTDEGQESAERRDRTTDYELDARLRTRSLIEPEQRHHLPPVNAVTAKVVLPAGWRMVVDKPIYFRGSGYCSGGDVELFVGRLQYSYKMNPPLCRAVLVE